MKRTDSHLAFHHVAQFVNHLKRMTQSQKLSHHRQRQAFNICTGRTVNKNTNLGNEKKSKEYSHNGKQQQQQQQ